MFLPDYSLAPVGEPQDLRVQILNSRSARATWTGIKKGREASRGKLLGYKVYKGVHAELLNEGMVIVKQWLVPLPVTSATSSSIPALIHSIVI